MPLFNPPGITGGPLTAGELPYTNLAHTSFPSVVLGTTALFWDNSNAYFGISTAGVPASKIHVVQDDADRAALRVDTTGALPGGIFVGDFTQTNFATDAVTVEICAPAGTVRRKALRIVGGALTNISGGELVEVAIVPSDVQFGTGTTLALQRTIAINAPTYSATSSKTLSSVATLTVQAPVEGTNVTIPSSSGGAGTGVGVRINGRGGVFVVMSSTAGADPGLHVLYNAGALTTYSSGLEYAAFEICCAAASNTVQWNGNVPATQRWIRLEPPTYACTQSRTITSAAILHITSAALAGTNMAITNNYSIWVEAGACRFDGGIVGTLGGNGTVFTQTDSSGGGGANPFRFVGGTHLSLSNAEAVDFRFDNSRNVQFGQSTTLATQRSVVVEAVTYTSTAGTKAITDVATMAIEGPPVAGSNVSFTNGRIYGLWIQTAAAKLAVGSAATSDYCFEVSQLSDAPASGRRQGVARFANGVITAATAEVIAFSLNLTATQTYSTLPAQVRMARFSNISLDATSGSSTLAFACCLNVGTAAPSTANLTITQSYSFHAEDKVLIGAQASATGAFLDIAPLVVTTGTPVGFKYTGAAHTTLSNAEASDVFLNFNRIVQFGQNTTLALQRAIQVLAPTYASSAATKTITDAVTLDIDKAPQAGGSVAITNAYALRVQAGETRLLGGLRVTGNLGFFAAAAQTQQTSGANLTNNVSSGGTDNTVDNVVAAAVDTSASSLTSTRDAIYQLARKLKQVNDALRLYGLLT